jgi:hypothetical protein
MNWNHVLQGSHKLRWQEHYTSESHRSGSSVRARRDLKMENHSLPNKLQ